VQATEGQINFLQGLPPFDRPVVEVLLRAALDEDPQSRPSAAALAAALGGTGAQLFAPPLPGPPAWLTAPMQALAFWVAYQNCIYRHHDLPEGAIVAEFTRLVDAEIGLERVVVREPMYRDLLAPVGASWHDGSRCDLAIRRKGTARSHGSVEAVVEVKRASVSDEVIDDDLLALHELKQADPSIRAFLLLVSQAHWPQRWVSHLGTAERDGDSFTIAGDAGHERTFRVRVRRVTKATPSFRLSSINAASYCCLLEVF
jgi:hypothetical protein